MNFRETKVGQPIYMLNRDSVVYCENKVVTSGLPHLNTMGTLTDMVMDITLDDGKTYTVKDSSEVAYTGSLMLTPCKQSLLREIEAIRAQANEALSRVDHNKQTVSKCDQLLVELNPEIREKKENEQRLQKLEGAMNDINSKLALLLEKSMP